MMHTLRRSVRGRILGGFLFISIIIVDPPLERDDAANFLFLVQGLANRLWVLSNGWLVTILILNVLLLVVIWLLPIPIESCWSAKR